MTLLAICCPHCGHLHARVQPGQDYPDVRTWCTRRGCRQAFRWWVEGGILHTDPKRATQAIDKQPTQV